MIFSAMPFHCPPVCTRKPANSELSFRHRAPVLHYDWCTQPHPSLVPSNTFCISTLNLPHSAMNCGRLLYIMNKPFGLQSNRMAGIAAFPTPASSPAMSSLPLPVEQVGPVFHAHCTHRPVACSSITVEAYCAATAERPAQRLPPWFQSTIYSHRSRPQTHIQTNTQPRQAYYNRIYNTSEALPGNLVGASRNHFFTPPSPPVTSTSPNSLSSEHVSSASSSCGYLRAHLDISQHS